MVQTHPQTADATIEQLEDDGVSIMTAPDASPHDYVVWVPHTHGPVPSPLDVWHDHHQDWTVQRAEGGPETVAYYVTAP